MYMVSYNTESKNKNKISLGLIITKEDLNSTLFPDEVKDEITESPYYLLIFISREDVIKVSCFPTNTNFDVIDTLIKICKEGGAEKIYLGSFPLRGIPIKVVSDILNLKQHFESLGAELVFLDNSDFFDKKNIIIPSRLFEKLLPTI